MSPNKKGGLWAALSFSTSSGIFILSKEMLVLSFVGFLADVEELRRNDMPAFGEPPVAIFAIQEFGLGPKMVLR